MFLYCFWCPAAPKKGPDQASENGRVNQYEFLGAGVPTKNAGRRGNDGGQLASQNIALVEHARDNRNVIGYGYTKVSATSFL